MAKRKNTKRALVISCLSLLLCVSMLVGTTFAWFTDNATTSVSNIVSGTLDIQILDASGKEKTTPLTFVKAADATEILWEPGATYRTEGFRLKNNGNLWLKYKIEINNTDVSSNKLNEVITWSVVKENGDTIDLTTMTGEPLAPNTTENDVLYLQGTMSKDAGNAYQGLTMDGISITVLAAQYASESDSFGNNYDKDADYAAVIAVADETSFGEAVKNIENGGIISMANDMTITDETGGDLTNTGKTTTIDFNNTTATGSNGNIAFRVRGNSVGNIQNGTIVADANTWSAISAAGNETGKAVANISNMTLSNSKENGNCVRGFDNSEINIQNTTINSSVGGCVEMANGTLNIQSGTFTQIGKTTGAYDANSMNVAVNSGGTANIYGGTFTSETYGLYVMNSGGTMNVYGGTFKAGKAVIIANFKAANAVADCVFNIYGGSFDGKIWMEAPGTDLNIFAGSFANTTLTLEQFKAYVAEGSTVTEANGVFTVSK